jgi:hypothetical protein
MMTELEQRPVLCIVVRAWTLVWSELDNSQARHGQL